MSVVPWIKGICEKDVFILHDLSIPTILYDNPSQKLTSLFGFVIRAMLFMNGWKMKEDSSLPEEGGRGDRAKKHRVT